MAETAYVAFGSNIGDGRKNIEDAIKALDSVPGISVEKVSSMYITKPWGYTEQDDFVNACARLKADVSPEALLGICLGVEAGMGRERIFTNGPRIIDIDVLLYGNLKRNTNELVLPHPRMYERDFVLIPLSEVVKEDMKRDIEKAISVLSEKYIKE